jgi:hypothetical protein
MKKEYEIWSNVDKTEIQCSTKENIEESRKKGLLKNMLLKNSFVAYSYEEAMSIYHLRMGYEPYKPNGEAVLCPNNCGSYYYPLGSSECPNCGIIENEGYKL